MEGNREHCKSSGISGKVCIRQKKAVSEFLKTNSNILKANTVFP